jgi:hypothetical protein
MIIPSFVLSLLRHTGYALVVLAALLIGVEFFVPAFATPYVHLYRLLILGLVLCLLAGRTIQGRLCGRWGIGVFVVGTLILAVFTQLSVHGSTMFLALVALALIVFFLF